MRLFKKTTSIILAICMCWIFIIPALAASSEKNVNTFNMTPYIVSEKLYTSNYTDDQIYSATLLGKPINDANIKSERILSMQDNMYVTTINTGFQYYYEDGGADAGTTATVYYYYLGNKSFSVTLELSSSGA